MPKLLIALIATLFTVIAALDAFAAVNPGTQITRPVGYKPLARDAALGKKLFKDTKLSTNAMSCASCHANHGAFQASFAKPYPHTVVMAKDQFGRKTVHLDEMIQVCMVMLMAAKPLPWDSKQLAGLTAYLLTIQKTFKPSH